MRRIISSKKTNTYGVTFISYGVFGIPRASKTMFEPAISYYFYIYNLNIENLISYLAIMAAVGTVVVSLFAGKIQRKLGYKISIVIGLSCMIISAILKIILYRIK